MQEVDKIWMNGKFVDWNSANVHFLTHALHYGSAVFEGIRCYNTNKGPAVFRLNEHVKRLFNSAKILGMKVPYSQKDIINAIKKTIKINKLKACYIRPLIYYGYGKMGLSTKGANIDVGIAVWPWGAYLGEEGIKNGIRVKVSSFARHHINIMMTKAKVSGNYANSILAKKEVLDAGYDEAVMLDSNGFVSECTGENLFIVRDNTLITPPETTILEGITRDSVIQIALKQEICFKEQLLSRDQLYIADEVFLCGTAAEVTPVREIDNRTIGKPGSITKQIQSTFFELVKGNKPEYEDWLDYL